MPALHHRPLERQFLEGVQRVVVDEDRDWPLRSSNCPALSIVWRRNASRSARSLPAVAGEMTCGSPSLEAVDVLCVLNLTGLPLLASVTQQGR